tara:strand:+ start:183 stop:800 length:618 start_codon:yes stop_codon:yes gene_type:complete
MVNQVEIMKYDLFPTHVVRSKCLSITPQDKKDMMWSIDSLLKNGHYTDNEQTPKYQTPVVLFQDHSPAVWHKLKKEFYNACRTYLESITEFCKNQDTLDFTGSGAWAYKGWESLNKTQGNPWHNHSPAFLSGVYYLHDPGDGTTGGTEFHDPRVAPAQGVRMQEVVPIENTWIIFPGWLSHRSVTLALEEPRYVIAANIYARVQT